MKTIYKIAITFFALGTLACSQPDKPQNTFVTGSEKNLNEEQKEKDLDSEKDPKIPPPKDLPDLPPPEDLPDPTPDDPPPADEDPPPADEIPPPTGDTPQPVESHLNISIIGQGSVSIVPQKDKYYIGDTLLLTASPVTQWSFVGFTGDLVNTQASGEFTIVAATTTITASFVQVDFTIYSENFESYEPNLNPLYWINTDLENANTINNSLFLTATAGTAKYFATSSTLNNIHSHVVTPTSSSWKNYRYTADLRISDVGGGIGLTFLSKYDGTATLASDKSKDKYYRLRRLGSGSFNIVPHPNGKTMTSGVTNSSVIPAANTWYRVIIEVSDTGTETRIKAKIWVRGTTQPTEWQIDCVDAAADRIRMGTVGIWTNGLGSKHFDNIKVETLP
ncbi:MAG: hypothetical protein KBD78_03540 [Oligoflexales bacterium]|nr:hypothetical protein [Oligoflexales bacterium]